MVMTDELFEQYQKLVYHCYRKLEPTKFVIDNKEDLIQEGFLAMITAINNYEEHRSVPLSSYIYHLVKYRMWDWINTHNKPYSILDVDISEYICVPELPETHQYELEEFVSDLLTDYRYYLENYKSKKIQVDLWVDRAAIILEQYIKQERKVPVRFFEENFGIGRTLVSTTLKDLRVVLTMKQNNTLYIKGDKND